MIAGEVAQLSQGAPDLRQSLRHGNLRGQRIRPHLDSASAHIVGQDKVFARRLDILAQLGLVGRVVIERAAQSNQLDFRIGEPLFNLPALLARKVDLYLVSVARAEFHPFELRRFAVPDDGGDIPILRQIVGDRPKCILGRAGQ